jgi:hypothetical protein
MKKTLISFGFALAVTSTALGGIVAVTAPAQGNAVATKQYCC